MAKVDMHLGFTFRVGPLDMNQYGRVDVNVNAIDTDLDTETQMEAVQGAADIMWSFIKDTIDTKLEEVLDKKM